MAAGTMRQAVRVTAALSPAPCARRTERALDAGADGVAQSRAPWQETLRADAKSMAVDTASQTPCPAAWRDWHAASQTQT